MVGPDVIGELDRHEKVWIRRIRPVIGVLDCGEIKLVICVDTLCVCFVTRVSVLDDVSERVGCTSQLPRERL